MALKVEIGNKAGTSWTDLAGHIGVIGEEAQLRVGGNAYFGEVGTGSAFDIDDDEAEHDLPVWRVLRVRETATSPDTILLRGRVAVEDLQRGDMPVGDARVIEVQVDDHNADLRGIPIRRWGRPAESDYRRVIELWRDFLKGSSSRKTPRRASTRLHIRYRMGAAEGQASVRNANRVALPAIVYRETDPFEILRDIADAAGKEFFVTTDSELFYDLPTSTRYAAGLSITDLAPNPAADEYPPEEGVSGSHDGSEFLTGVVLLYGRDKRLALVRSGVETAHDVKRRIISIDAANATQARRFGKALLSRQAREDRTYSVDVELPATKVDLVKYGQMVSFRSAAAGVLSPVTLRVGRLMWEPVAPDRYIAHMELGFPKKLSPRLRTRSGVGSGSGTGGGGGGGGGSGGGGGGGTGGGGGGGGAEVTPPDATTTVYLDHFDRLIEEELEEGDTAATVGTFDIYTEDRDPETGAFVSFASGGLSAHTGSLGTTSGTQSWSGPMRPAWSTCVGFIDTKAGARHAIQMGAFTILEHPPGAGGIKISAFVTPTAFTDGKELALLVRGGATPPAALSEMTIVDTSVMSTAGAVHEFLIPIGLIPAEGGTLWIAVAPGDKATEGAHSCQFTWPYQTGSHGSWSATGATADTWGVLWMLETGYDYYGASGIGNIPLSADNGGSWWPGDNPWIETLAPTGDDSGVDGAVFFFEASTPDAQWGYAIDSLDGRLPFELATWEALLRYRLTTASVPTDPGSRYALFDWSGGGATLVLFFGDTSEVEGISVEGDTTDKADKSLGVGVWNLVRWQSDGAISRARVWTEGTTEPTTWDVQAAALSDTDIYEAGRFNMTGRLGNDGGTAQRFELDYIRITQPDGSKVGYAGEVYGLVATPEAA